MQIREVVAKADKKLFLELPLQIYKDDPNWIRPLDKDIEEVFDPQKNKFFRHGKCTRFLLFDDSQKPIGRIAAFINDKTSRRENQPTGGIGFFECINDKAAAHFMFDHCKMWLQEKGMEAMDGPINFGERDAWWGLITYGFSPVPYKMNYNKPYYVELFESYGFQIYFEQYCFAMHPDAPLQEKLYERHKIIAADKNYRFEYLKKNKLEKYAEDFRTIYNKAWVKHGEGKALESKQVQMLFNKMKPVMDEKIIYFVYYKDEPVAFFINIPDINQLFRHFNGKFGWIEKLRFVWMLKRGYIKKFLGIVFGVIPEHQGKGVDSYLIIESSFIVQHKMQYEEYEMQWIGDFNPRMISVAETLTTHKSRILKTYRYLFDRDKEFKRHPYL
ncbi:MAG: hypothetical protein ABI723_15405 [Bacteroidia bacterium]